MTSDTGSIALEGVGRTQDAIRAGGTLRLPPYVAHPSRARKYRLIGEIALLYLLIPIAMLHALLALRLPLFTLLPPLLAAFLLFLVVDPTFSLRVELTRGAPLRHVLWVILTFLVLGGMVAYAVAELMPRQFLALPRHRPHIWQRVMLFYPLLSVIPQELAYRTFFFHRYGPLFQGHRGAMIVINGLLFGFGHVLFGNWVAVVGTMLTGTLFAFRYSETRSIGLVWLEHTLWGWLVFTVGLGVFFFTGIAFQGDFSWPWTWTIGR